MVSAALVVYGLAAASSIMMLLQHRELFNASPRKSFDRWMLGLGVYIRLVVAVIFAVSLLAIVQTSGLVLAHGLNAFGFVLSNYMTHRRLNGGHVKPRA